MHQPLVELLRGNRMNARDQRLEPGKSRRKRLRGILCRGSRDRRKSKRGSSGRTLQETAPRISKNRIQIWLVHDKEEVYLGRAQVVKVNEKPTQTKRRAELPLPPQKTKLHDS